MSDQAPGEGQTSNRGVNAFDGIDKPIFQIDTCLVQQAKLGLDVLENFRDELTLNFAHFRAELFADGADTLETFLSGFDLAFQSLVFLLNRDQGDHVPPRFEVLAGALLIDDLPLEFFALGNESEQISRGLQAGHSCLCSRFCL